LLPSGGGRSADRGTVVSLVGSVAASSFAVSNGLAALYGLLSFVAWIIVLVWIYNIARRKGRHAVGWLILGLFFWLVALVIVLLLPSKRTTDSYQGR
jgi:hypothetical protein